MLCGAKQFHKGIVNQRSWLEMDEFSMYCFQKALCAVADGQARFWKDMFLLYSVRTKQSVPRSFSGHKIKNSYLDL